MPGTASGLPQDTARDGNVSGTPTAGGPAASPAAAEPPLLLEQVFGHWDLRTLRATARAHAIQAGMPADRADELSLVVHELAANATPATSSPPSPTSSAPPPAATAR